MLRWFAAGFLGLWLCGWACGEAFGLATLLACLGGILAPDLLRDLGITWMARVPEGAIIVVLFLLVWAGLWTIGGILAIRELLSLLWGNDRIEYDASGIRHVKRIGPFRSSREWRADSIRRVRLLRGQRGLAIDAAGGTFVLTRYGSNSDRAALRDQIQRTLGTGARDSGSTELPPEWESEPCGDGSILLFRRHATRAAQARTSWIIAALFIALLAGVAWKPVHAGSWSPGQISGALMVAAIVTAFLALAAWLTWGREEIAVRPGVVEFRRSFRGRAWADAFRVERLRLARSIDSDGDEWFALNVAEGRRRRLILRTMNEPEPVLALAHWLAQHGGATLDVDRGVLEDEPRRAG